MWKHSGDDRPAFAETPGPGQESVWDYPRPPAVVTDGRAVEVFASQVLIASTSSALRVCETASPPTFYLPWQDVVADVLVPVSGESHCEWKGRAQYWGLADADAGPAIAWSYPSPRQRFAELASRVAFFPGRARCFVAGERVRPQPGGFYGGWITDDVVGPFKGEPGTGHW